VTKEKYKNLEKINYPDFLQTYTNLTRVIHNAVY